MMRAYFVCVCYFVLKRGVPRLFQIVRMSFPLAEIPLFEGWRPEGWKKRMGDDRADFIVSADGAFLSRLTARRTEWAVFMDEFSSDFLSFCQWKGEVPDALSVGKWHQTALLFAVLRKVSENVPVFCSV